MKKNNIQKLAALLLSVTMILVMVTGCGGTGSSTEKASADVQSGSESSDSSTAASAEYTLKLAHDANTTSAYHLSALELERTIEEASGGRINVEVYPAQQLGSASEMIEGMQMGTIEATLLPTAKYGGFDQTMTILDMPFLFPDEDAVYDVMNGEGG